MMPCPSDFIETIERVQYALEYPLLSRVFVRQITAGSVKIYLKRKRTLSKIPNFRFAQQFRDGEKEN